MARPTDSNEQLLCSFCGKSQRQVKKLIAGPGVYSRMLDNAQQQALVKMKPRCFRDIVVEVAIIRPGPLLDLGRPRPLHSRQPHRRGKGEADDRRGFHRQAETDLGVGQEGDDDLARLVALVGGHLDDAFGIAPDQHRVARDTVVAGAGEGGNHFGRSQAVGVGLDHGEDLSLGPDEPEKRREFQESGWQQIDAGARIWADAVHRAYDAIETNEAPAPFDPHARAS